MVKELSSATIQTTSRTIKQVRRSTFKILKIKTRKETTNTRSMRTKPTHNTMKHSVSNVPQNFDCPSTMLSAMATNLSAKNATTTSNSSANASNTSVSSTRGSVLALPPISCLNSGNSKWNVWSKIRLLCMAETIRTKSFTIKTRTSTLFSLPEY